MNKALNEKSALFLSGNCAIYIGLPLAPDSHSHHVTQLCLSIGCKLVLRTEKDRSQIECNGVVIGKNVEHLIYSNSGIQLLMFIDNTVLTLSNQLRSKDESEAFNDQILVSFQKPSITLASVIHSSLNSTEPTLYFDELKVQLALHFGLAVKQISTIDPRIIQILNWFNKGLKLTSSGEKIAKSVNLSESRLQHLFKEEVGIPIRRYLLWMRLKQAVYEVTLGLSLTEAAHKSGFSDSAHLSRTFKSMFGISPSSVFSSKNKLEIYVVSS